MIVETARAKVNLALHVVGRRADGYHLLDTVAVFPDLGDTVAAEPARTIGLAIEGPGAAALAEAAPEDNLVLRAARALAAAVPGAGLASLTLTKVLPVAAGLGGGSADAAAALRALCRLAGLDPLSASIAALAAGLGADVPMCLVSAPLRARGIGERIDPLPPLPPLGIVLANPGVPVATPAVFRALAARENPPLPDLVAPVDAAGLLGWLAATRNDLEAPAIGLAPAVATVLGALRQAPGCRFARMSGSGATCFALTDDRAAADRLAAALRAAHPAWWIRAGSL